jgi:hypothetical protein
MFWNTRPQRPGRDEDLTILLAPSALTVIDIFRAFDAAGACDLAGLREQLALSPVVALPGAKAADEPADSAMLSKLIEFFLSLKTTMPRPFSFRQFGSPIATQDEITLLILLSSARRDRFGIAGEAVLRLGLRDAVGTLHLAHALGRSFALAGLDIGEIDRRLMQNGGSEVVEDLLKDRMSRLRLPLPLPRSDKSGRPNG